MSANLLEDVLPGIALGTASSLLALPASVSIGAIAVQTSIEENYEDTIEVTDQPVEQGADITDHSYVKPSSLLLRCGWSNSTTQALLNVVSGFFAGGSMAASDYVSGIYSQLLALQQSRQPLNVQTALRQYQNMLILSLRVQRDERTYQALMVTAVLRQIIIVSTQTTTLPPQSAQANPASTAETQNVGSPALTAGAPSSGGSLPPSSWTTTVGGQVVSSGPNP